MLRLILVQLAVTLIMAIIAALIGGQHAGLSALLGGASCVIPNGLFALRLHFGALRPGTLSPMTFFIGEFIKIAMTLGMLVLIVWWYRDVNWLALIVAFIVALKSYIILLVRH